eukprot:900690_1
MFQIQSFESKNLNNVINVMLYVRRVMQHVAMYYMRPASCEYSCCKLAKSDILSPRDLSCQRHGVSIGSIHWTLSKLWPNYESLKIFRPALSNSQIQTVKTMRFGRYSASGCQTDYESSAAINDAVLHPNQGEILSGDLNGNIRVWDLTANACRYELELEREEKALPEQADAAMCDSDSGDDSLDEDEAELWTTVVKK